MPDADEVSMPAGGAALRPRAAPDEFYRAMFRSSTDVAMVATDVDGRVTDWNPGAERLLGWSAADMQGQPFGLQHHSGEGWQRRADGTRFWARSETLPLLGLHGEHLGALLLLRDRTEQHAAAERQRADAEFMRGVLASSGDCIKVLDLDGALISMSEGGQRVMEVTDFDAIRGCQWQDFWSGEAHADAAAAIDAARAGGVGKFQAHAKTMGGNLRHWDVRVTPMQGADGKPERLLSISRDITATWRIEEALRAAQDFNTAVLNSSRDCIVVMDLDARTVFVSPGGIAAMEMSDVSSVIGLWWLRVWTGTEHDAAVQAVAAARAGGTGRFRGFCPTHKGTPKWWDVALSPLLGADGKPERLVSVGRDITEQVLAQERLALSEATLRLTVEAADVGTWDLDLRSNLLSWSDRTKAMFGISPGMACSMDDFYGGLHPDDLHATGLAFATALDPHQRATYDVEYRTVGKEDRVVRWVAAKGRGVFDADGTCVRALGTAIDITARKVAQARQAFLLGLWQRLQALTDPRAIMTCAAEALGRHLGVSRVGYGLVQPDDESIALDVCHAEGVAPLTGVRRLDEYGTQNIARQRRGVTVVVEDVRAASAEVVDWEAIDVRALVSVPLIRDGRFRASLYVNHVAPRSWPREDVVLIEEVAQRTWDAVERARAEAAQRQANETLEQRIAEALEERKKIEEALRQSQKMEAVGQLTGGLAHDFNNLLTGIAGSLELLQTRVAQGRTSEVERYVAAAQGAARRAAALTHRLLAFSRRQTLDPRSTDINRLVAGMEELIRRTVGPEVAVEVIMAEGLWSTLADPGQLENALLNLCINARDAMPDGGKLTIETGNRWLDTAVARARDLPAGQYVSLCVSDTGIGMTPDVVARAFDPFFTTKPIGKGTGLGLSMIYGFVRQSGGQTQIHSAPGAGTTVCLYLPRHAGSAEPAEQPAQRSAPSPRAQGETVLIVDDEPSVRMLVAEVLEDIGYIALQAADGAAGLKVLQSATRVDLLVTDVGLPGGMNGRQVADAARLTRPRLKVLFITGYAENAVLSHGHLDPGMHVLTKPFALEALAVRIRQIIDG